MVFIMQYPLLTGYKTFVTNESYETRIIYLVIFSTDCNIWYLKVVRCGRIMKWGDIMKRFGMSCVRPVYFIPNSTEFHKIRMEFQRIIVCYLLFSSHKLPEIAERCTLPYYLPDIFSLIHPLLSLINLLST